MNIPGTIIKNLLPVVQPYIPQALESIEVALQAHMDSPLQPGETRQAVLLINGKDGKLHIMDIFLNSEEKIVRVENIRPAREFLEETINTAIKNK